MVHVEAFDNMDDAFAAMDAAEKSANENLLPGQVRLRDAVESVGYWVKVVPEYDGLIIYGRTEPVAETQKDAAFNVADNRARGYLTGTAFSLWEPEGEPGDTHVSEVIPVGVEEFSIAQRLGWPTMDALTTRDDTDHRLLALFLAARERKARA